MGFLQAVIPFVVMLVLLVVWHELGHFITAKLFHVKVLEFAIGYPPKLWSRWFKGTEYSINALPLGGFCRVLGEEDPTEPGSLARQAAWKRLIILGGGAAMNAVLPIFLFAITFMIPQDVPSGQAEIQTVAPGSPAAQAGLKERDVILSIDGREVKNISDALYLVRLKQGHTMDWKIRRQLESGSSGIGGGGQIEYVQLRSRWAPPEGQGPTGVVLNQRGGLTERRSEPIWTAFPHAARTTWEQLVLFRNQIIGWVAARNRPEGLAGPVGIAQVTGDVVREAGWVGLVSEAALLSINLAVFNLLPIPMLDGGRILFVLIEIARRGKRVRPEREAMVHAIGFVVLMSLVLMISFFDVLRIYNGHGVLP